MDSGPDVPPPTEPPGGNAFYDGPLPEEPQPSGEAGESDDDLAALKGVPGLDDMVVQLLRTGRHSEVTHRQIVMVLTSLTRSVMASDPKFANEVVLPVVSAVVADMAALMRIGMRGVESGHLKEIQQGMRPGLVSSILAALLEAQWTPPEPSSN